MNTGKAHVGTATILTVFMVLCLSIFGVLSVVSAQADLKLSRKTGEMVQGYYAADTLGEETLSRVDRILGRAWESVERLPDTGRSQAYLRQARLLLEEEGMEVSAAEDGIIISWSETAGEQRTLEISLRAGEEGSWEISQWQMVREETEEEESFGIDLWDGAA